MPHISNRFSLPSYHNLDKRNLCELTKNSCSSIVTTDNDRTYHVLWNESGSCDVVRDKSNLSIFDRMQETFKRGLFTKTFAQRLAEKIASLSKQVSDEAPMQEKIKNYIKIINAYNTSLHNIDPDFNFIASYPHVDQAMQDQYKQNCLDIRKGHFENIVSLKNDVHINLTALKLQLVTLQSQENIAEHWAETMPMIKHDLEELLNKIINLDNMNIYQQLALKSFIVAINLTKCTVIGQYLVSRTQMWINTKYSELEGSAYDERIEALKEQNTIANKLILQRKHDSILNEQSVLDECSDLMKPPEHRLVETQEEMNDHYQQKYYELLSVLMNPSSTWAHITHSINVLSDYKQALEAQIQTGKEIHEFLCNSDLAKKSKQKERIEELKNLQILCESSDLNISHGSFDGIFKQHVKSMSTEVLITTFLDEKLLGDRGMCFYGMNFYRSAAQRRINSLIEIENLFLSVDANLVEKDVDQLYEQAKAHMDYLYSLDLPLIAKCRPIPPSVTEEKFIYNELHTVFGEKTAELKKELDSILIKSHHNILVLQKRREAISKLHTHSEQLVDSAEIFSKKATHLNES